MNRRGIFSTKRLMTNVDLLSYCRDYKPRMPLFNQDTVHLRVKVLSVSSKSIRVQHCPLLSFDRAI